MSAPSWAKGQPSHATPTHGERKLAVLFIDDDASVADSLSMVLSLAGFEAVSASDGNEAIARLQEGFHPDFILSDYRMPTENGLNVVARRRSRCCATNFLSRFANGTASARQQ
jgi:CheY-like chemotaxis protein